MKTEILARKIRSYFKTKPVEKAWLFGSYSRGEQSSDSDIDILVEFVPNSKISLFDYGGMIYDLEQQTGKRVDLVQNGLLKPYAKATADKDKMLIYERSR